MFLSNGRDALRRGDSRILCPEIRELPEVPFLQEQALRPDIPQGAGGCIRKGGGLLQTRAEREMPNAHGGGELEDEKGG